MTRRELLSPSRHAGKPQESERPPLSVHLDTQGVVYVENVTLRPIETAEAALRTMLEASRQRHVTATKMNAASSRSHLVSSVVIRAVAKKTGVATMGKLTLVDLAGSESVAKTGAKGNTLLEAQAINKQAAPR